MAATAATANASDGTAPFPSAESLKLDALNATELRSAALALDECLKNTRAGDASNSKRLAELTHSNVVAHGRLVQTGSTDAYDSILSRNIIDQSARYINASDHATEDAMLDCANFQRLADERLNNLASSFRYTQTDPVLIVVEGSGIDKTVIARGAEILATAPSRLNKGRTELLALMHHCNRYLDAEGNVINGRVEAFERETEERRDSFGQFVESESGKLANLGGKPNGSSHVQVEMNYGYNGCEEYVYPGDRWNRMGDPEKCCVGFWRKACVTVNNHQAGHVDYHSRGPEGGAEDVTLGDRVLFLCGSNKDGDKTDMPIVCAACDLDEVDMHLARALFLACNVMRVNMDGRRLAILATGKPNRDKMFELTAEPRVSKHAYIVGWLPHSEMCMRRGLLVYYYGEEELQQFSKTANLSFSFVDKVTSCMISRFFEDWTGLSGMTPEMKAILDEAARVFRSKGGSETAQLFFLSKAWKAAKYDAEALPAWALDEYERFLAKHGYQGDEEKLLRSMEGLGLPVCIALNTMSTALVRTAKPEEECFSSVVLGRLLVEQPELRAELNTLRAHYKDDEKIFEALADQHKGPRICHALSKMSSALVRTAKPEEQCFSNVVLGRLLTKQPELQAELDTLRVRYGDDEKIFEALADQHKGPHIFSCLSKMSSALVRTAKAEEQCFSNVVLGRLLTEQPELQAELDTLRAHYKDNDEIFEALAGQRKGFDEGRKKGVLANKVKAAEDKGSERMLLVICSKPGCKCDNQATEWIGDKVNGAENLTYGQCLYGPQINSKDCDGIKHTKWSLTGVDMELDEFKAKHGLQEKEGPKKKKAARKTSKKRKAAGSSVARADVSSAAAASPDEGVAASHFAFSEHPTAPAVRAFLLAPADVELWDFLLEGGWGAGSEKNQRSNEQQLVEARERKLRDMQRTLQQAISYQAHLKMSCQPQQLV